MDVQRIEVNLVPGGIIPVANLSQGDTGRVVLFELYDGGTEADLSNVQICFLSGKKPDGNAFTLTGSITAGNCVTVISTYQSTILSGSIEAKLIFIDSNSQIKSALLTWEVEPDPSSGAGKSNEEIQDIIAASLEIKQESEQNAHEASESALSADASKQAAALSEQHAKASEDAAALSESNAEAWAKGTRGGVPVDPDDETYENNAKHYSVISGSFMHIAGERAEDSEAYAKGTRNGNPVEQGDPAYENNAEYYANLASSLCHDMVGATAAADGDHGLVPKPLIEDREKYLRGDGTWHTPPGGGGGDIDELMDMFINNDYYATLSDDDDTGIIDDDGTEVAGDWKYIIL